MSSLRNAVKRVTHKERAQPQYRSNLGLLEKKSDYKLRSKNYHLKELKLKGMRSKAAMRNPDEFYFGMNNAKVVNGSHRKNNEAIQQELEDQIGADAVRIMKDQDLSYVRMHRQKELNKINKMQSSMHFLGNASTVAPNRKHTIFVETQEEADQFDVATFFDTAPELTNRAFNRPRIKDLRKLSLNQPNYSGTEQEIDNNAFDNAANARADEYNELLKRKKRLSKLKLAEAHLETQKLVQSKGQKRKIKDAEDGKPAVYKWRTKRCS